MKYMGSKARHARALIPIVLKDRQPGQWYFEPFVGGANMIDKVGGLRCGTDINAALIALHVAIRDGWVPPDTITEVEYGNMKSNPSKYPAHLLAFAGFGCAFGAQWFGTYARGSNARGEPRNYARETRDHLLKQAPRLAGCNFFAGSYSEVRIPQGAIIYCDPPYSKTTDGYVSAGKFNSATFWAWATAKADQGHQIFVSEYIAPPGWRSVWEKPVPVNFDSGRKAGAVKVNVEKLWVPE